MADLYMDVDVDLAEVPINIMPLLDDTTFKDIEAGLVWNQAGLVLVWNFVTTAGAMTQTAVVPTNGGAHDWTNEGNGLYAIEIPAAAGTINNNAEGFGWFSGVATGVLPWRGPVIGFRAAAINNSLVDGATIDVNVTAISGDTGSADNLEAATDGNTYNVGGGAVVAASVAGAVNSVATQVTADVTAIHGQSLAESVHGYLAAAFQKFFDKASPTGTINSLPDAVPGASGGLALTGADGDTLETLSDQLDTAQADLDNPAQYKATGFAVPGDIPAMITGQQVRDAMKLDASVGAPAAGSVDAHLDTLVGYGAPPTPPTANAIADQVWDEATAGHLGAGSFGLWASGLVAAITAALTASTAYLAAIAAAVWTYATRTLTSAAAATTAAVTGSDLNITAHTNYAATLSGMTIPADWLKIWFTLKSDDSQTDAQSIVQIVKSNPGVASDGLLYLNGAAGTAAQASLTVNQAGGTVAIAITAAATAQLGRANNLGYDIACLSTAAGKTILTSGAAVVELTETRTVV